MGSGFSNVATGIGNLAGAAGSIYGAFQDPANPYKGYPRSPFTGVIGTPAYSFGGGQLQSTNQDFLQGQRQQRDLIGNLQSQVEPGYGKLTTAGVNAIRQQGAQASGNLRAQLFEGLSGDLFAVLGLPLLPLLAALRREGLLP